MQTAVYVHVVHAGRRVCSSTLLIIIVVICSRDETDKFKRILFTGRSFKSSCANLYAANPTRLFSIDYYSYSNILYIVTILIARCIHITCSRGHLKRRP